jgi:HK97 family phage portal protein
MYQVQSNVFACVDKIANLVARLDTSVFDVSDPDNEQIDHDGPYAKLMHNPCFTVDPFQFYHWWVTTYEVYGEVYGIKNRNETTFGKDRQQVRSIIPMHPAMTEIHRNPEGGLMYRFMGMPNELFPETEIVCQRRYNPFNTMRGLSRLEPLRLTLMNEDGARRAQIAWWDNMCRPSMVLSTPKKLGRAGRERLQEAVNATQSSADNAGGALVLEDEVTASRMQLGAEEMQYIQSRMFNREEAVQCTTLRHKRSSL